MATPGQMSVAIKAAVNSIGAKHVEMLTCFCFDEIGSFDCCNDYN